MIFFIILMILSILLSSYLLKEDYKYNYFFKSNSELLENKDVESYVNENVSKHIDTLENEFHLTENDNEHNNDKDDESLLRSDCKKNLKIKARKGNKI